MNSLIYKFATEAGAYCETYLHGGDPKPPVLDGMNLEKFAELIVRECAKVAAINQAENMGWNIGEIIKEHFEVDNSPMDEVDRILRTVRTRGNW